MTAKLAALKAQQTAPQPAEAAPAEPAAPAPAAANIFAGAAEEAGLITWPSLGSVVRSTAAVLAIVVAVTVALLSLNALLAASSSKLFD